MRSMLGLRFLVNKQFNAQYVGYKVLFIISPIRSMLKMRFLACIITCLTFQIKATYTQTYIYIHLYIFTCVYS